MENDMESNMENDKETEIIGQLGYIGVILKYKP